MVVQDRLSADTGALPPAALSPHYVTNNAKLPIVETLSKALVRVDSHKSSTVGVNDLI